MSNDSEKGNKIWKIVAWFLLSLSLLVSVLILIFETWDPELLKSLKGVIPDKQIYKQIIAIIALLASVSLLSFLIQIYTNKEPKEVAKIWKIVAYPVHWAFRLIARFLLLVIRSAILILLLILLMISTVSFKVFDSVLSKGFELALSETLVENPESLVFPIITIIIVIIAMVLIPHQLQRHAKGIWKSLLRSKERISEVLRSRWLPGPDIDKSLSDTQQYYSGKIRPSAVEIRTEFRKLVYATLILCIAFGVYVGVAYVTPSKEWKILLLTFVDIHDHSHPDLEKKILNHPHPGLEEKIPDHSHKPSTSYRFNKGTQFLLVYEEGNLETKEGICPRGSNLKWLELFKTAISDSPKDKDRRMKLKIQGFASVAPVPVDGIINDKSDTLNCEIANQRAEALIYFLTTEPYDSTKCRSALENSSMWGRKENGTRSAMPDTNAWKEKGLDVTYETRSDTIVWKGPKFDVAHKPWQSYDEMKAKKPKENPQEKEERQLDREFLNRSVRIIIEEGSDQTETTSESSAEDNTDQVN